MIAGAVILLINLLALSTGAPAQVHGRNSDTGPITCSVMEVFDEGKLDVRAVVFHQRDKADAPRLGSFLLAHSGQEMELQSTGGRQYRAAVFRVKSAFGRGLVLLPVSKFKLGERDEFNLRLPEKH
jgi:hypothetical protein